MGIVGTITMRRSAFIGRSGWERSAVFSWVIRRSAKW